MSAYPEHDKLHQITDESETIGEFIDIGLPKMGLILYEKPYKECLCKSCRQERMNGKWHAKHDEPTEARWYPSHRSVQSILAKYFGVDLEKIDAEKDQMLREMRAKHGD
jgi:hypothetical protein